MSLASELQNLLAAANVADAKQRAALDRIKAESDFAARMAAARPEHQAEWEPLIRQAAGLVVEGLGTGASPAALAQEAEAILAPLSPAAREYEVICCGHAHIDMNWMWPWPETVSLTYDTFATMDRLMDEFPRFHFSQSQASVYIAMKELAPELWERIRQRIAEGRWEVTASQWVEGDKNMASGEILARHLLYTRRWFKQELGLPFDAVKVDWEPDTFGHCWTLPGILRRGGVTRYYHHRSNGPRLASMSAGQTSQVFWWEGKDGSRVLAFDDSPNGYNNEITPRMTHLLLDLERHTGLKTMLWVYGVGDHGGGPTRRHLRAADDMATWPIWPRVTLGTTDDFFSSIEKQIEEEHLEIPVHKEELNFVFEGCYTSESRIKFANRRGECDLQDTEIAALLAGRICGRAYPRDELFACWRRSMFLQFHDILPGSGVKETIEHAMGGFQENLASTGMIRTQSLRALAGTVDTTALTPTPCPGAADMGLGAGVGNEAWWSGMSTLGAGECGGDPFVVFNTAPFVRSELVKVKVWNRELPDGGVIVRDSAGNLTPGQILERGHYWGHQFTVVAFWAAKVPAMGHRAYLIEPGQAPTPCCRVKVGQTGRPIYGLSYVQAQLVNPVVLENDRLEVTVSSEAGGVISLIDKQSGCELVPDGEVLGVIQREQEAPHGMTAWQLGATVDRVEPLAGCVMHLASEGPNVAAVLLQGRHNDSEYRLTISLAADSPRIDFDLEVNWLERGDPATGVPALRVAFPIDILTGTAIFETACGIIERPANGEESPALNWAALSGVGLDEQDETLGATLLNDSKYGYQISEDMLRLTLLRSSYDPDPLPELGRHNIRFALQPHVGAFDPARAVRAGYGFNHPLMPVGTTVHGGLLPPEASLLEVLSDNVMLSGLKLAEDGDAVILRLYEFEGIETQAQVAISERLVPSGAPAVETDLLEQPLASSTARLTDGVLTVSIPPFGIATVKLG